VETLEARRGTMITVYYCRDGGATMNNPWRNEMGCGPFPTAEEAEAAMLARVPEGQPDITSTDATDAVEQWRIAAGEAGDDAMVETCSRTLDGDHAALSAWCRCEREADASFSL
jgi:hypothetical protein